MKKYVKPDFEVLDFQMNHTVMETCTEYTSGSSLTCLIGGQSHSTDASGTYFGTYDNVYYAIWNGAYTNDDGSTEAPDETAQSTYAAAIQSVINQNSSASLNYNSGMGWHIAIVYSDGETYYDGASY